MKKIVLEGLEGQEKAFAEAHNAMIDKIESLQGGVSKQDFEDLKKSIPADKSKEYTAKFDALQLTLDEIKNNSSSNNASATAEEILTQEIKALGVNNVAELKSYLDKNGKQSIELKAISAIASTANTDTVGRTNLDTRVVWTPTTRNAFIQRFRSVSEMSDKSKFGYTEGSYTSAANYVGEGTGNSDSDSASASAYFMEYAKIQAVLSVNTEVYEDIPDFAAGLINQLTIGINAFADSQLLDGDGLAPAGVQHIKGILAYATAWADADYDDSVEKANVADLVDVISSKIQNLDGNYQADLVFLNNVDFLKMKKLKDNDGQPIINKDYFGNFTLGGLTIVPTKKIDANTMVVMDSQVGEIRTKRSLKLQMGQLLANDALNDKQSAIISTRVQFLIRNLDTQAVIKVTDVNAAVAAINIPAA